jgi:signal transduction histidine kinase
VSRSAPRSWSLARRASVLVGLGWLGIVIVLGVLFAVTGRNEAAVNDLLNRASPAQRNASALLTMLFEEQDAVHGYALTGDPARKATYQAISERAATQAAMLRRQLPAVDPTGAHYLDQLIDAARAWRVQGAEPLLASVGASGPRLIADSTYLTEEQRSGAVFDAGRRLLNELEAHRDASAQRLRSSRGTQLAALVGGGMLAAVAGVLTILLVRRWVTTPIDRLAADARRVADGDHEHQVGAPSGPSELAGVAADVEKMRSRIVSELAHLAASQAQLRATQQELRSQAVDLMRSNRDLEQFAYVASHDLQEPLRKVAGFCQLLKRRYSAQLDERGEQYIEFAVDGARRMQRLIAELLRFSRVGRAERAMADVSLAAVAAEALAELRTAREAAPSEPALAGDATAGDAPAEITVGKLPVVHGDEVLLRQLLTNLVGNGLKFHRPGVAARVSVTAEPDPDGWRVSVSDNGIGIAPEFAEKIFVLFQRLHAKETYTGTGIGLALAKRIVEYHGGRIWLDTEHRDGTTIRFTLPAGRGDGEPAQTPDPGRRRHDRLDSETPAAAARQGPAGGGRRG